MRKGVYALKKVEIFTDGACLGNPGPGGWGTILRYQGQEKILAGGEAHTTNNRMELTAVIEGFKALKESCEVSLYSDSQYVVFGLQKGWAEGWAKNGWRKSNKEPVLNPELWEALLAQYHRHKVQVIWVRGHDGHPENERCDKLAVEQAYRYKNGEK